MNTVLLLNDNAGTSFFSLIEVCHEAHGMEGNTMAVVGGSVIVGNFLHASDISIVAPSLECIESPS